MDLKTRIENNVEDLRERIAHSCERCGRKPADITVIAVTKTVSPAAVEAAFRAGIDNFGENRVQEAAAKLETLPALREQATWHMLGHLQTNKAKTASRIFDIIHSVDSLRIAEILDRCSRRRIPVFMQVNISREATKGGFPVSEVSEAADRIRKLKNIELLGLMTIAPLVSDPEEIRPVFRQLRQMSNNLGLKELSMGMTDDFEVAIEEGATSVRIGRAIFGERMVPEGMI